jgi:uncharacterized membrane protein YdbT with pleckstrin-like domain
MTQNPLPLTPPTTGHPHTPADDTEQVYFEGSPLLRNELGKVILYGIGGLVLLAIGIANLVRWKMDWPWWVYLGLLAAAALITFFPMLMRRTVRYRITNYRIDITYGVLSKSTDTIELWHVEDIRLHQSLINRIANVGTITITAHDQALPMLPLRGLPHPAELFKMLEQRVIAVKRQQGVMKVDPG